MTWSVLEGDSMSLPAVVPMRWVGAAALVVIAAGLDPFVGGSLALLAVTGYAVALGTRTLRASIRDSRAAAGAPGLVALAVLRLRLDPSLETAILFATANDSSQLAQSLARHRRRALAAPHSGFESFAEAWRDTAPALSRAVDRLVIAVSTPDPDRDELLDGAFDLVLDGIADDAEAHAATLSGPTTALYAFGVLLPLSVVAVIPAAAAAGVPVTLPVFAVTYDVVLPLCLLAGGGWLLTTQPVAFRSPSVPRDAPMVDHAPALAVFMGVLAVVATVPAVALLPMWAVVVLGIGLGTGSFLMTWFRPIVEAIDDVEAVEAGLSTVLDSIGRRVSDGEPVETAIDDVADATHGRTGDLLESVGRIRRSLPVTPAAALSGTHAPDIVTYGDELEATAQLLAVAADVGAPAGDAIVDYAAHLDRLRRVETDARRSIANVTGTLRNTARIFGPVVAGTTVALAGAIDPGALSGGDGFAVAQFGPAVGAYVLSLAAILTAITVTLERGPSPARIWYRVGIALVTSSVTFVFAFALARTIV